jgi:hypothetical protein
MVHDTETIGKTSMTEDSLPGQRTANGYKNGTN